MRALCEGIAAQDGVKDVRVLVTQFDEPDWWPFSDAIYVMTSAEPEEVLSWFPEELAPDEVFVRLFDDDAFEPYDVPQGIARSHVGGTRSFVGTTPLIVHTAALR